MSRNGLLLLGAGGHSNSCIDVVEHQSDFQIVGLVDLPENRGSLHLGYSVIGSDEDIPALALKYSYGLVSVGQIETADLRMRLFFLAVDAGLKMPVIVSPTAYVSRHAIVGEGSIIMHGAIVNAGATIGKNCIVNTQALVEHDASVGDHCHISTNAILNGDASIGTGSFVGSGTIISNGVTIGERCVVGMGLSVRHRLNADTHFVGYESK